MTGTISAPTSDEIKGIASASFFLTGFGLLWALGGAYGHHLYLFSPISAALSLIALVLIFFTIRLIREARKLPSASNSFNPTKSVHFISAIIFEAIAIPVSIFALNRIDQSDYLTPVIAVIVGIHFLIMMPAFKSKTYLFTGAAMCLLSIATILILPSRLLSGAPPRIIFLWMVMIGYGCAIILWSSAVTLLAKAFRWLSTRPAGV